MGFWNRLFGNSDRPAQSGESESLHLQESLVKLGNTHDPAKIPEVIEILQHVSSSGDTDTTQTAVGALARLPGGLQGYKLQVSAKEYKRAITLLTHFLHFLENMVANGFKGFAPQLEDVKKAVAELGDYKSKL